MWEDIEKHCCSPLGIERQQRSGVLPADHPTGHDGQGAESPGGHLSLALKQTGNFAMPRQHSASGVMLKTEAGGA